MEPFTKQQLADFLNIDSKTLEKGDDAEVIASYLQTHGYEIAYKGDGSITAFRDGKEATAEELAQLMAAVRNERPL